MASGFSGQQSFRKAIEAIIKDSTSVGIANFNCDEFKGINVSILKATNHVESLPKEKHVEKILAAVSGSKPRADVAYCIHALRKRLRKTHSWVVALKTLIVMHRASREVDNSFFEELSFHSQHRGRMLNLSHFKDNSSPLARECSSWIRTYALYIEEYLQCFRLLKYDLFRNHSTTKKLDTLALLQLLPALQRVLIRLLCCKPTGAARFNYMIQYALSIVAADSVRLYVAITDGVLILVDKFFEMQQGDAVPALDIYRRAMDQAQRLSEFYEMCRILNFGTEQKYVKIEQPPAAFLAAMEDYVNNSPQALVLPWTSNDDECVAGKLIAVHDPERANSGEGSRSSDDREETNKAEKSNKVDQALIPDLLSWDEPSEEASESVAAAPDDSSETMIDTKVSSEASRWELPRAKTQTSDASPVALCKEGVVNKSVLDSLYETAAAKPSLNEAVQTPNVPFPNPFEADDQGVSHHDQQPHQLQDHHTLLHQQPCPAGIHQQQPGVYPNRDMHLTPHHQGNTLHSPLSFPNPFLEQAPLPDVAHNQFSSTV